MAPIDLNLVRAFTAVHRTGSFSEAAKGLGVPRSTVSRSVAALEDALGTRLFHRTTRKVATTRAGAALYDRLMPALTALEASLAELPDREDVPTGVLRITGTADVGAAVLAEAAARFTARYPQVRIDVLLTHEVIDLVRDGFDLALRISSKRRLDSSLVAQKVGDISIRLYASPSYLARAGEPRSVEELQDRDWVVSLPSGNLGLKALQPRVTVNDMYFLRETIKAGAGIGPLPSFITHADVAAGALVQVLPKWGAPTGVVHLVQPSRKHPPRKVTLFRELVVEILKQRPL